MQVASVILIYLFRFVVFGCLKNRVEYGSAPPVITFLSGKATMIASITHFVMANILLLIAYLILYVENVSREVESFLSALVIIGFSILVLLYVLLCIRDIISRLVHCKRDREKGGRKASAIQQKIRVMAHIYNEISRSIYDYLRLCEGGFKIAQQLDEMAVTHRRRMDGTIFSSSSSASSDDMVPFGGGDRNTLMMQFRRPSSDDDSLMSDMDVMHTGLSGGMRFRDEENSFLKDWHTLDEPDMVVPTDNANWLTKEDVASAQPPGEGDLITSKDGESAGSGEYQSVPFPVHQPTLNRCPSMRFSIRNVKKTPADDTAKQGDEETTLGHSSGKAADSIPPPATPPPALPPDTLAMSLNALLASDPVDVASHFDPMAVPPLPVVKPKSKPPQNAQDILKEVRDASPPEMNSGWQSAPGLDLLASLRGVDSEEARSLLHMLQLAPPAGTSAGNETDVAATHGETPAAAKDTTNAQSEHKASEATDTVPDPEVEKPQLPPPLPVFSRPELPKSDRHSRAKQKQKLARKKEKERRKENASGPPPERKKGGEDADTNRKRR
ncbi:hypothetical protein AGDE_14511 [Angomonas deanei]|uniref:Uncharacterized protein n=1 Tax=Angomonas deanei TaxID=59799 RepID=A0A7G2C6S9_9TRYP|nr:hypothetical protein AGDE_14511 [Angomonas deanei]CAD2215436.1 hypothetical protein, conserved [Angomonas deanei]|eukprot:EPY20714.1 hypothetical protein AGDE_14511 [Angomonas deanei]